MELDARGKKLGKNWQYIRVRANDLKKIKDKNTSSRMMVIFMVIYWFVLQKVSEMSYELMTVKKTIPTVHM